LFPSLRPSDPSPIHEVLAKGTPGEWSSSIRENWTRPPYAHLLLTDADLAPIRARPEFKALVAKLGGVIGVTAGASSAVPAYARCGYSLERIGVALAAGSLASLAGESGMGQPRPGPSLIDAHGPARRPVGL
jgi:hypothetical protein